MNAPIYTANNIEVTPTFARVGGVTYPLANITSIRVVEDNKIRLYGIAAALFGVVIATGGGSIPLGVAVLLGGIVAAIFGMRWHLVITTGAAERQALTTTMKDAATKAGAAITVAIEQRDTRR